MNNIKYYNIFILISTFARNIIEIFSMVILYKIGFSLKQIMLFYIIYFITSTISSIISLVISSKYNAKYILLLSSFLYTYSFYFLSRLNNNITSLIIFAILLAISNYTYHPIRHYYAIKTIDNNKNNKIASILIFNYIAIIISSYLGAYLTKNIKITSIIIILLLTSLISIVPLLKLKYKKQKEKIRLSLNNLKKDKVLFFIFEQGKVIFLLLQSLYLYIYVKNDITYLGLFNVILGISSIITIYIFSKTNNYKFKLFNSLLCTILILKINIINPNILLILAFFEGIGIKIFEVVSTKNIYNINKENIISYLIIVEVIFCLISSFIFIIFYFINNLKLMLYICIVFIFICGLINPKIDNNR